jgi:hypothetical protein
MKTKRVSRQASAIPPKAVLLIPEPENAGELAPHGIKPGYYDAQQMLQLLDQHKSEAETIQFIADMLETGDPESDGFANMLRTNCRDSRAIARMIKACKD